MKKNIFFGVILGVILTIGFFIYHQGFFGIGSTHHAITLTEDGFEPSEMTIAKNDSVTFRSTAGKYFWPASDLHPTHEIYSAFDPQEPIEHDKSWTFRFTQTGTFRFHDHLAPYHTGIVIVNEK